MRYLFGFMCVLTLGVMPLVGCSETTGDGGNGGTAGSGGMGGDGGTGGMAECQSPEDCDDDNECTDDTCSAGICEFIAVPDPTGPEQPGDPPGEGTKCGYYEGTCEGGSCVGTFACTEAGIREAIAAGAGPHTFNCEGPTTVVTTDTILIDNDVILDGEGRLTVDGNADEAGVGHTVFIVAFDEITVELRGIGVTGGGCPPPLGGAKQATNGCFATGIQVDNLATASQATLTLADCTVWNNEHEGIYQNVGGTLTLLNTTVSGSTLYNVHNQGGVLTVINSTISGGGAFQPEFAAGVRSTGQLTMLNSTVSDGQGVGIHSGDVTGMATLTNCTVSGNARGDIEAREGATVTLASTIVDGGCDRDVASDILSNGYNIESPDNTCGFDQEGDQVNVSTDDLNLGPLADNGGSTMTHALLTEPVVSVAVDKIPEADCVNAEGERLWTDQRDEPRFVAVGPPFGPVEPVGDGCDVGAFEVQVPIKSGLWLGGDPMSNTDGTEFGAGWAICFNVNDDGTALTASTDCDIDGDDDEPYLLEVGWKDDVGKDFGGEVGVCSGNPNPELDGIGIKTSFAENIPIDNGYFQIEFGEGVVGWLITGTFSGDTATGTAMWEFSTGMSFGWCELVEEWTAAPAQ